MTNDLPDEAEGFADEPLPGLGGLHRAVAAQGASAGDAAAALGEVRARSERHLGPSAGALDIANDAVRHLMESAADVPRLLAIIDQVLELTDPLQAPSPGGMFVDAVGVRVRRVIVAELRGEGER
jgi:hypothetical protein